MAQNLNLTKIICCNTNTKNTRSLGAALTRTDSKRFVIWKTLSQPMCRLRCCSEATRQVWDVKDEACDRLRTMRDFRSLNYKRKIHWKVKKKFIITKVILVIGCNFKPVVCQLKTEGQNLDQHQLAVFKVQLPTALVLFREDKIWQVLQNFKTLLAFVMCNIVQRTSHKRLSRVDFCAVTNIQPHAEGALVHPGQNWMFQCEDVA